MQHATFSNILLSYSSYCAGVSYHCPGVFCPLVLSLLGQRRTEQDSGKTPTQGKYCTVGGRSRRVTGHDRTILGHPRTVRGHSSNKMHIHMPSRVRNQILVPNGCISFGVSPNMTYNSVKSLNIVALIFLFCI